MTANGAFVEGGTSFFLPGDPSKASQEVLLAVYPGPTRADYENLQLQMYPPGEYAVWQDGGVGNNGIIQLADTISFSAYFQGFGNGSAPIVLQKGWTEVGYLPTDGKDINDALASLTGTAVTGDPIVGASGFAQFVEGKGWIGSLTRMTPGQGYRMYAQAGGRLIYPMSQAIVADVPASTPEDAPAALGQSTPDKQIADKRGGKMSSAFDEEAKAAVDPKANPAARSEREELDERRSAGPQWKVDPARYPASMALVIDLQDGGQQLQHEGSRIAVMDGDEIRGLGWLRRFDEVDDKLAYVLVYGGLTSDEERDLSIAVYDGASDEVYDAVGTPVEPLVVDVRGVANAGTSEELPREFALGQNYPNPFNPTTTIQYDLPQASVVKLAVFDVLGRHVLTLVDGEQEAGWYNLNFDASQIASGVYFYTIDAGDFTAIRKMMLLK